MRVHLSPLPIVAALAFAAAACSPNDDAPTSASMLAPASETFLVGDRNDEYTVRTGLVNVCAFFGNGLGPSATFSASATGGTVLGGNFTVQPNPGCIEVWNATSTATVAVASALVSNSPDFALERIVTAVGTADVDATFTNHYGVSSASVSVSSANGAFIWFKFAPRDVPPPGGQGCTPGYWKQSQHFGSWTSPYTPTTTFASAFGSSAFGSMTMLQVLSQGGGGMNALGRHAAAALLNAASANVAYDLSVAAVISRFNTAAAGSAGAIEAQKNQFDMLNNQGCPLGRNP